jgi:RNA polymerase sigma factor (sigma-70 family)
MNRNSGFAISGDRFPKTRWSAIVAARSQDPIERECALETIIAAYWKPIYKYIRIKWHKSEADAADLVQGFFTKALEKNFFHGYDPSKARFRTFLCACLDGFVANEEKAARRLKRGGAAQTLSLDFQSAEGEFQQIEIPATESPETYFEKEWMRSLFSLALDALRAELEVGGKQMHFQLFELYYLGAEDDSDLSYAKLAERFEITTIKVTNYLALARREFRRLLLERLRELTATEEEFKREVRALFGTEIE